MKKILNRIVIAGAMIMTLSATAIAEDQFSEHPAAKEGNMPALYPGVGPVMAESVQSKDLPAAAREFIQANFPDAVVVNTIRQLSEGDYTVDLDDGTDLEFNSKGEWVEIEAGLMRSLSPAMVKRLVPAKAYDELARHHMEGEVDRVKRDRDGYKVEIRETRYDDFRFSNEGHLLSQR